MEQKSKVDFRVIGANDLNSVTCLFETLMASRISDESERRFAVWRSHSRTEALEHYLKLGWSFGAFSKDAKGQEILEGYFISQPLLFVNGQTQSLWIETIESANLKTAEDLLELALKVAKEKNFQRALIANAGIQFSDQKNRLEEIARKQDLATKPAANHGVGSSHTTHSLQHDRSQDQEQNNNPSANFVEKTSDKYIQIKISKDNS
jgi:hypothetical protein